MQLAQTRKILEAYAECLDQAAAGPASDTFREVASFLAEFENEKMSTLVSRGSKVEIAVVGCQDTRVDKFLLHLNVLGKLLISGGTKSEITKDLAALGKILRSLSESGTLSTIIDYLREAMQPGPIEHQIIRFIEKLKRETGTDAFNNTLARLEASRLKREHVVAIAMSVYGGIKTNTSRKAALEFIRKPHEAFMSSKKGIDATGGRTAA